MKKVHLAAAAIKELAQDLKDITHGLLPPF